MVEIDRCQSGRLSPNVDRLRGLECSTCLAQQNRNRIAEVSDDSRIHLSEIRNTVIVEVRRDDLNRDGSVGWNSGPDVDERAVAFAQHYGYRVCIAIGCDVVGLAIVIKISR